MAENVATRTSKPFIWTSWIFLGALALKVLASFYFSSPYLTDLFTPFVNWFVTSGFQNPWDFFYGQGMTRMFPYPALMLWIMAAPRLLMSPLLSSAWQTVAPLHLFTMRLPLLAFDALLLFQLTRFFPAQQKRLLWIYWCSPIVFFISYIHGQLDIVPTAILFGSVYLLIGQRTLAAFLILGLAAATKSHVLVALPFFLIFLYKKKLPLLSILGHALAFAGVYAAFLLPYFSSTGFQEMVLHSPEQRKLFDFVIPVSTSLNLVVCPTVVLLIFTKFASYKKLNREILLMFLGIVFVALVVFVPPMPGWFMWSMPFLIYFYMHNKDYSRAPFILYNVIYVLYFVFFFEQDRAFASGLPVKDLALSIVMASVGYIALWMFNVGVRKNEEYKVLEAPLLVGIGGDSGSGKHTLVRVLRNVVGKSRAIPIFGDDFHKWERGNENWQVYTHLHPSANRLHENMEVAVALKDGRSIEIGHYDHKSGKFTNPSTIEPNKFIFVVGLHPYYLKRMRDLIPIKIFLDTDETLRKFWKLQRDVIHRGYEKSKVLHQIAVREEDKAKYIDPQKDFADLVIRYATIGPVDIEAVHKEKIPVKTVYTLDNSVNLDRMVGLLSEVPSLRVSHHVGVTQQEVEISGTVSAREIMNIALQLDLNFEELSINPRGWLRNSHGVTQLIFLELYHHHMRNL